jgi:sugar phosphate isomerase/epimerase
MPRIHLAIDNCFASKRWTTPDEWSRIVAALGLRCIEASADTECDPLYDGREYLSDWAANVQAAEREHNVKVVNLYSGHGTYATLGLAHTDVRVQERLTYEWLFPMVETAARIDAGLGFFCHAFPQSVLQSRGSYAAALESLYGRLAEVAAHAGDRLPHPVGVEQMYTPHQYPWRIPDALDLVRTVSKRAGSPFYSLLDVGHQSGQHRFLRPRAEELAASIEAARSHAGAPSSAGPRPGEPRSAGAPDVWLGSERAYDLFDRAVREDIRLDEAVRRILALADDHPHLFASQGDGDPYRWLAETGAYSPIVHLQQTDGRSSPHKPFTPEYNEWGIITGEKVLQALAEAYAADASEKMPPRIADVYLTVEVFSSTADRPRDILDRLRQTIAYWRAFVPEDGLELADLV